MSEVCFLLIIHMCIMFIYTEIIFKAVSNETLNKKIITRKTVYEITRDILISEGLWSKVKLDMSADRKNIEGFYDEKERTIQLSSDDGSAQAIGAAIHECGHAIQYNKSNAVLKLIKIRDALKKFSLFDAVSPLAVPFFEAFCMPLYIVFCIFLLKLISKVIIEFLVEADANLRILKYIKRYIPNPADRKNVRKFLMACSLTYLSTLS